MRNFLIAICFISLLGAKEIQTPLEKIDGIEFLGQWQRVDLGAGQRFIETLHEEVGKFLKDNSYHHALATLYKRDLHKRLSKQSLDGMLLESYNALATRTYDLKDPVPKIMVNYLDETHPDFENIKRRRVQAIDKEMQRLLSQPLHVKQQFFLHNNALLGLDIAFSEQSEPLDESMGGRMRFGLFSDEGAYYLFIHDTLSQESSVDKQSAELLKALVKRVKQRIQDFFKPSVTEEFVYLAKEVQTITPDQLVISAVADDSDSSRVECDPSLTLNTPNVKSQLAKIDSYIYKVEPHFSEFLLPESRDGVIWKSFYWKHKKSQLAKELANSGVSTRAFKQLVSRFIQEREGTLKQLFRQGDIEKVEVLFQEHVAYSGTQSEPMVALFKRLDILDVLALGMK